jgi:transglutaminase-like putative cysteine protease
VTPRRYRIVHTTQLKYSGPVQSSHNELRMTPISDPGQTTLESRVRVKPLTWSHVYTDYWGTRVTAIEALDGHVALDVESISTVERTRRPSEEANLPWEALAGPVLRDLNYEWLRPTRRVQLAPDVLELARTAVGDAGPRDAVDRVMRLVRERVVYQPGVTGVYSSAQDAWVAGRGVCQDHAHVVIAVLRHLGVPCRYVSGYLAPGGSASVGDQATGESHAWVEWWDGTWLSVDPTNPDADELDHIVVARGRDYDDVPPIKGVFQGADALEQAVSVTFTRLA